MSNKELIRKAFNDACVAMEALEKAKTRLADLHYKAELVENMSVVLERVTRTYEPSNDAHEAVFVKQEQAKESLNMALANKKDIYKALSTAHLATSDAYSVLNKV